MRPQQSNESSSSSSSSSNCSNSSRNSSRSSRSSSRSSSSQQQQPAATAAAAASSSVIVSVCRGAGADVLRLCGMGVAPFREQKSRRRTESEACVRTCLQTAVTIPEYQPVGRLGYSLLKVCLNATEWRNLDAVRLKVSGVVAFLREAQKGSPASRREPVMCGIDVRNIVERVYGAKRARVLAHNATSVALWFV